MRPKEEGSLELSPKYEVNVLSKITVAISSKSNYVQVVPNYFSLLTCSIAPHALDIVLHTQ